MNKLILLVVGLALVGGVGYIVMTQMKGQTYVTQKTANNDTKMSNTTLEIQGYKYSPATLTVKPGETVWVTNKDSVAHTVTSDDKKSFDTGLINQNGTISFTAPMTAGTYTFHCTPHPTMKGTLIVQ